jgi:hypothetical protein
MYFDYYISFFERNSDRRSAPLWGMMVMGDDGFMAINRNNFYSYVKGLMGKE